MSKNRTCRFMLGTYEVFKDYATLDDLGLVKWSRFAAFNNLVMELWVADCNQELKQLDGQRNICSQHLKSRRENIHKKLQRICPGVNKSLGALRSSSGNILVDDQAIANELAYYWGEVFSGEISTIVL